MFSDFNVSDKISYLHNDLDKYDYVKSDYYAEDYNPKADISDNEGKKYLFPYYWLAKMGVINYKGVMFYGHEAANMLSLGNVVADKSKVISVNLSSGGTFLMNMDCLQDFEKASAMFSEEDYDDIIEAINIYNRKQRQGFQKNSRELSLE